MEVTAQEQTAAEMATEVVPEAEAEAAALAEARAEERAEAAAETQAEGPALLAAIWRPNLQQKIPSLNRAQARRLKFNLPLKTRCNQITPRRCRRRTRWKRMDAEAKAETVQLSAEARMEEFQLPDSQQLEP